MPVRSSEHDCTTREKHTGIAHASQKHEPASTGSKSIAPWCGRAFSVDCDKPIWYNKRSLTRNGNVPISSSEQDCASRGE